GRGLGAVPPGVLRMPGLGGARPLARQPPRGRWGLKAPPASAPSGAWLPSNDSGVSGHFDRDLALHAQLLVVVDRAVELVLARLQIDRQVSALSRGNPPLALLLLAASHVPHPHPI